MSQHLLLRELPTRMHAQIHSTLSTSMEKQENENQESLFAKSQCTLMLYHPTWVHATEITLAG